MAFPPNFTNSWDVTYPPDTQLANLLGADLRQLRVDLMQRMSLLSGTLANRPTPETVNATWGGAGFGLLYFATDTGSIFQWNGAAWVDVTINIVGGGKYKFEGSNIVPVTVANTNVLTALQSINIPANDIGVGQTFYVDCSGVIGATGGGQSIQIFLYADGNEIDGGDQLILTGLAGANNQLWGIRLFFTGLTTGVAGTIQRPNILWMSSPSMGSVFNNGSGLGAGFTIDTTVSHLLQLKVLWTNANPSNTITQNTMTCYRLG